MRISEIKALADNPRTARIIKYFWEQTPYRRRLENYKPENASLDEVFEIIKDAFLVELEDGIVGQNKSDIQQLSEIIYGDKNYWAKSTKWEVAINDRLAQQKKAEAERAVFRAELTFLYGVLGIQQIPKNDLIGRLAKDKELSEEIISKKDQLHSRTDLYNLCEGIVVGRILSGSSWYRDYSIMCTLSSITFHDYSYWLKKNHIDGKLLMEEFQQRSKREKPQ